VEQNSIENEAPATAEPAAPAENPAPTENAAPAEAVAPAEKPAPVRRRASRRVSAAAGEAVALPDTTPETTPESSPSEVPASEAPASEAPKKRVSRARKKAEPAPAEDGQAAASGEAGEQPASAEAPTEAPAEAAEAADAAEGTAKKAPTRRKRQTAAAKAEEAAAEAESAEAAESTDSAKGAGAATKRKASENGESAELSEPAEKPEASAEQVEGAAPRKRNTRSRSKKQTDAATETSDQSDSQSSEPAEASETTQGSGDQPAEAKQNGEKSNEKSNEKSTENGRSNGETRSSRTRQRERKRRGGGDEEPEITEDDVLLPIAGILDVLDNYAFVRTSGYLPGTGDVYVSLGQVKKYGMRKGDAIVGAIRQPREGEGGGRQKYNAIVKVDSINSKPVDENQTRPEFAALTPVYPEERLRLETEATELSTRVVDLFAPIGKGQRGLIVGPHESGKSRTLQQIAKAVSQNQADAHLMLVLIDERPEEVTALTRTVNGEVIASTFERPAEDHATIAELAVERAKRLVELGHDVVVLIDSLTALARAYNLASPPSARVPAGTLDAAAVLPVKRLLSAARNIENGGSLTIIATVSGQPESRLDQALIGELEGVANMQLRLSGDAADRRVFPAVDLARSSTRNERLLTSDAEAQVLDQIRRALADENQEEGLESVLKRLGDTSSNVEFLALAQRGRA